MYSVDPEAGERLWNGRLWLLHKTDITDGFAAKAGKAGGGPTATNDPKRTCVPGPNGLGGKMGWESQNLNHS